MSRSALDQTLEFINTIDRAASAEGISRVLIENVRRFGFTHILAGTIPLPGASEAEQVSNIVLHHWPENWSELYFSKDYITSDPTIRRVTTSIEPFTWSDLAPSYKDDASAARIMSEAKEHRLGAGFTIPMMTLEGRTAGLSVAGERAEMSFEESRMIQLLGIYGFAKALTLGRVLTPIKLTPREYDVLHWMAEGKSDWDIAMLLNLSEHRIDNVARSIRRKLGAVTRTQAMAYAFRHNLIR